ncbi:hypothetical protein [Fischerella thermalis]|uniref:hypothetical protein n=1 Tax=Fischerella thermalis TaxID=372787 RepID=UPI0015E15909|nr:hypothetical protein [Fischerella thermalis]
MFKSRVLAFHRHGTLPGTCSGPKVKVKPATEVNHDDGILLKKTKTAEFALRFTGRFPLGN